MFQLHNWRHNTKVITLLQSNIVTTIKFCSFFSDSKNYKHAKKKESFMLV